MLRLLLFLALLPSLAAALPVPPQPESVAVIYNSRQPESKKLASAYAIARGIPTDNLIGLDLPETPQISRDQFERLLHKPLVDEFDRRSWWQRERDEEGVPRVTETRVRILVCVRGVPSRIAGPDLRRKGEDGKPLPLRPEDHLRSTAAAVDSELALLAIGEFPAAGPLTNPYYKMDQPIGATEVPLLPVGRLDGPSFDLCQRMIRDALAAEETGLWGMAVIDIANKSHPKDPNGDPWLRTVAEDLAEAGIPCLVDSFSPTLPVNFPLKDTALYYGWYDWHVSGPFKNPGFRFRRGAVAVHLHSFSAAQLGNAERNWCAPLLAKGAAATLGNVHEPLLHLTHNFDIFQQRLLAGYTLVEAAYMSNPALSWQGVVLGDPLYRPYLHLDGSGRKEPEDAAYRALRIARLRWGEQPEELEQRLRNAAGRMEDGVYLEALGLELARKGEPARAAAAFAEAGKAYSDNLDKLRMDLLRAKIAREERRTAAAVQVLREARRHYSHLRESEAAAAWLNILDPPAPPPAKQ